MNEADQLGMFTPQLSQTERTSAVRFHCEAMKSAFSLARSRLCWETAGSAAMARRLLQAKVARVMFTVTPWLFGRLFLPAELNTTRTSVGRQLIPGKSADFQNWSQKDEIAKDGDGEEDEP